MWKFLAIVIIGFVLSGCAQQQPAKVVNLQPDIYKAQGSSRLSLSPSSQQQVQKKIAQDSTQVRWIWPTKGSVLTKFSASNPNLKGIDISGTEGAPVLAASDGEVVYSGSSLRGYGNLIIIKHKNNFLSAYAHNRKNMVKEGDRVVIGQRIAEMGRSGTDRVKLHFEVRYQGKPVDPQGVLPLR